MYNYLLHTSTSLGRLISLALVVIMVVALIPMHSARAETIISSNITENTTWDGEYRVTAAISLVAGVQLTINPGTTINFDVGAGIDSYGQMLSLGEVGNPVVFTSTTGNWRGLKFLADDIAYGPSELWGTVIEMGGTQGGSVMLDNAQVTIADSEIRSGVGDGVRGYANGTAIISDTLITGQAGYALRFTDPSIDPVLKNIQAVGNGHDVIALTGGGVGLGADRLWENAGPPYEILGTGFTVPTGETLTIEAGVTLRFTTSSSLNVAGRLIAAGTSRLPITFTGINPAPGSWAGINIIGSEAFPATAIISHAIIEFGGTGAAGGNLRVENGRASVQYSRLAEGGAYGVHVADGGLPNISYSQIVDNALGGVKTLRGDIQVPALYNWWGDPGGPFHPVTNPDATGNSVSDNVLYDPWLDEAGLAGPSVDRPAELTVQVIGRANFVPGSRQTYAIAYRNGTSNTITDAVVVAFLPNTAYYQGNEGAGYYWAEREQIFWRLGSLAPGQEGIVALTVEYAWGTPFGVNDAVVAAIGGSNASNDLVNVADYLSYTPPTFTRTALSPAQLAALLAGNAEAELLYNRAIGDGYHFIDAFKAERSDGLTIHEINLLYLGTPLTYQTVMVNATGAVAHAFNRDGYAVITTDSLLFYDPQTEAWTDLTIGLSFNRSIPGQIQSYFSRCMNNCTQELIKSKIFEKLVPVASTASEVSDCVEAANDQGNTDAVLGCGKAIGSKIPVIGDAIDYGTEVGKCNSDCQGDPASHICTQDKKECNSGLSALTNPAVTTRPCDTETGMYMSPKEESCGAPLVSKCIIGSDGQPKCQNCFADMPRFNPNPKTSQQELRLTAEAVVASGIAPQGVDIVRRNDVYCPFCQLAQDPNAKLGVEGLVGPGQILEYTVQYENVGEGEAYGVFVMDRLADVFDETTLVLGDGGRFMSGSRTIFWDIGTLAPKGEAGSSGEITFSVQLRSDLAEGTVITNQAIVYFPSVPEVTPTNPVVNIVQPLVGSDQKVEVIAQQPEAFTMSGYSASGGPLSFTVTQEPAFGSLTGTPPNLTYTAMPGFTGIDHLYFIVSNGVETSPPAEVVFDVQPDPADATPPQLVDSDPADGETISPGVDALQAIFSEAIDPESATGAAVTLTRLGQPVSVSRLVEPYTHSLLVVPDEVLSNGSYVLQLAPPLADLVGNQLAQTYRIEFSVSSGGRVYLPIIKR